MLNLLWCNIWGCLKGNSFMRYLILMWTVREMGTLFMSHPNLSFKNQILTHVKWWQWLVFDTLCHMINLWGWDQAKLLYIFMQWPRILVINPKIQLKTFDLNDSQYFFNNFISFYVLNSIMGPCVSLYESNVLILTIKIYIYIFQKSLLFSCLHQHKAAPGWQKECRLWLKVGPPTTTISSSRIARAQTRQSGFTPAPLITMSFRSCLFW